LHWENSGYRIASFSIAALSLVWVLAYLTRGPVPIDETRYLAVAWEMWNHHEFVVPRLNGVAYTHKPPLLFWFIHFGWWLFGVNEWWPRLLPALFSLIAMALTVLIGRRLWPQQVEAAPAAALMLLTGLYWLVLSTFVGFDIMFTCCALAALAGILSAWRNDGYRGWLLCGLALGLGLLAKGPAIFIPVLITAGLLPWIAEPGTTDRKKWYKGLGMAVLGAAAIGIAWLAPAIVIGGDEFARELLWKATAGRIHQSFAHARPFWWYLPALLVMLAPWSVTADFWRGIWSAGKRYRDDIGVRLCLVWVVPTVVVFSAISGKQPHYLLPILPMIALLAWHGIATHDSTRDRRVIGAALALVASGMALLLVPLYPDISSELSLSSSVRIASAISLAAVGVAMALRPAGAVRYRILLVATSSVLFISILQMGVVREIWPRYDTKMVGELAARAEHLGQIVAVKAPYYGEFTFAGRLTRPVIEIPYNDFPKWAERNADALVILYTHYPPGERVGRLIYTQQYQGRYVSLLRARDVIGNDAIARNCNDFYGDLSCSEKFI